MYTTARSPSARGSDPRPTFGPSAGNPHARGPEGRPRLDDPALEAGDLIVIPPGVIVLAGAPDEDLNAGGDLDIPLTLSPPSGVYLTGKGLALQFLVNAPGRRVTGGQVLVGGTDATSELAGCLLGGPLPDDARPFVCPGGRPSPPGPGLRVVSARVDLDDGTSLRDTVTWDVREPPAP